jgi:predicted nuclease with TOPRIM domain
MSAYVDFFVRHGNDFIPLGDFSRSSIVYQTMKDCADVPWEKIIPLTLDNLQAAQTRAHKHSTNALDYINTLKDRIEEVKGFNNSIEEKLEQIEVYRGEITEWQQEAEEARYAENYFYFLMDLIEAAHDDIDANKYIYAGIEIGRPTIEDIYEVKA